MTLHFPNTILCALMSTLLLWWYLASNLPSISHESKSIFSDICSLIPVGLVGPIKVKLDVDEIDIWSLSKTDINIGGHWKPTTCKAYHKIAVIVPYRNHSHHLNVFMYNIHRFIQKQMFEYRVYLIEQTGDSGFNRGALFNVGFKKASEDDEYDCYILHDIDLLPEDDRNMYICSSEPRHMSSAISIFNYSQPYEHYFGGVVSIPKQVMLFVDGFSNKFFNWGGEDDDFYMRVTRTNLGIIRYPQYISKYKSLSPTEERINHGRYQLVSTRKQNFNDGLNNLQYKEKVTEFLPLYTRLLVEI